MPQTSRPKERTHTARPSRPRFEAHGTEVNSRAHMTIQDRVGRTLRPRGGHEAPVIAVNHV